MNDSVLFEHIVGVKEVTVSWLVLAVLFLGLWAAALFAPNPVGTVVRMQGDGQAQSEDGEMRPLYPGGRVFVGDRITTHGQGHAVIRIGDTLTIDVAGETTVRFLRENET